VLVNVVCVVGVAHDELAGPGVDRIGIEGNVRGLGLGGGTSFYQKSCSTGTDGGGGNVEGFQELVVSTKEGLTWRLSSRDSEESESEHPTSENLNRSSCPPCTHYKQWRAGGKNIFKEIYLFRIIGQGIDDGLDIRSGECCLSSWRV